MKNLLYKEFKLSIHPLIYVFMLLLVTCALAPGSPACISLVYICPVYTMVSIGINKSTTTNDLYYSCNLPIRRRDVVKARIASTTVLQIIYTLLIFAMLFIELNVFEANMPAKDLAEINKTRLPAIGIDQGLVLLAAYLITYGVFDLIYLPWYYKTGKTIVINMLIGILAVVFLGFGLTMIPYLTMLEEVTIGSPNANYFLQIVILVISILLWVGSKILTLKLASKNIEKLDF